MVAVRHNNNIFSYKES